jgi:hypothetical protein
MPLQDVPHSLVRNVIAEIGQLTDDLLKQVYLATHPAAQGKPASVPAAERNAEAEAELLATLAAEDDEEEEETL